MTRKLEEKFTQLCEAIKATDSKITDLNNKIVTLKDKVNHQNSRISNIMTTLERQAIENQNLTMLLEEMLYALTAAGNFKENTMGTENTSTKQVEKLVKLN